MTDGAIPESIEAWLKEFSGLLGASEATVKRGKPVPSRVNADSSPLLWWRCSIGRPAAFVWIGVVSDDLATAHSSSAIGEIGVEFRSLLDRASGMTGEISDEYPPVTEYETYRISTAGTGNAEAEAGELEVFAALIRPPAEARVGMGALMDVELPLTLRFGSTRMPLQELTGLGVGSVIELDGSLSDPVELLVNGRVIARGEAVVLKGCYALRISEIASPRERLFSAEHKARPQSDAVAGN
jgi:flagellar motor switch protein FliN/FliY